MKVAATSSSALAMCQRVALVVSACIVLAYANAVRVSGELQFLCGPFSTLPVVSALLIAGQTAVFGAIHRSHAHLFA